jgi:hypothetical protein
MRFESQDISRRDAKILSLTERTEIAESEERNNGRVE